MGSGKKEAARRERQGKTGDGMSNVRVKTYEPCVDSATGRECVPQGEDVSGVESDLSADFYRSAKKVKVLKRLTDGKPQRDSQGNITIAASYQSKDVPVARVEPNRKWFTNSRVVSQQALSSFRDAVKEATANPNQVLLKTNKLPMSLIRDDKSQQLNGLKQHKAKMVVETQSFKDTFGPKQQRKRVKLGLNNFGDLVDQSQKAHTQYLDKLDEARLLSGNSKEDAGEDDDAADWNDGTTKLAREAVFFKGQSRRIWNELYKVIDSSDVVLQVLDARDPLGTRCRAVEKYLKEEAPHKHLVFILNKCDLVPTSVAATWVKILSQEYPTLAFHASITNSFGKGSLIALLRQFAVLHSDRKQISCGLIGYPNAGKSSIINTLRKKPVCVVAPIAGTTLVWQYVTLTRRIYLIDAPGIVPPNVNDTPEDILLRGVVRVENVEYPAQYIDAMLQRCQRRHVERTYDVRDWQNGEEFLDVLARRSGKLLKGGEADLDTMAKSVLNDFLRGKLPWFVPPPKKEGAEVETAANEDVIDGRKGRLGEMKGAKRKRDDEATTLADHFVSAEGLGKAEKDDDEDSDDDDDDDDGESDDDFQGFNGVGVVLPESIGNLDGALGDEESGEGSQDDDLDEGDEEEDDEADDSAGVNLPLKRVEESKAN